MTTSNSRPYRIPYAEISRKLVADRDRQTSANSPATITARIHRSIRDFARDYSPRRPDGA